MSRMMQANVIATSGRAVEAAGDVDVLLLDKTGTITLGNRQAAAFMPARRRDRARSWPMPRNWPRSPMKHRKGAASSCWPSSSSTCAQRDIAGAEREFVPFSAQTRMSGVESGDAQIRKGAADAIQQLCARRSGGVFPRPSATIVQDVARRGSTPLVVADAARGARRHRAQGHRQGRHQGALRRAAPDGHQDHHDHRRQPADRRRDRRRGRRGRLPGRGHAGGEARR